MSDIESDKLVLVQGDAKPEMDMMTWIHTEGGRKCPFCGRYAKSSELGWIGMTGPGVVVDAYGHLPGFGCHKDVRPEESKLRGRRSVG